MTNEQDELREAVDYLREAVPELRTWEDAEAGMKFADAIETVLDALVQARQSGAAEARCGRRAR